MTDQSLLPPALVGQKVVKRSISIAGHATSVSLEPLYWDLLKQAAAWRDMSLAGLVAAIDRERKGSLSSALRLFVLSEALGQGCLTGQLAENAPCRPEVAPRKAAPEA